MLVDGVEILPRDYRALKQYYEIALKRIEQLEAELRDIHESENRN